MPASQFGPWSPIYSSTNPSVTTGPIKLIGTVSDVFSDGSSSSPAHELMPAFLWSGNQSQSGATRGALPRLRLHRQPVPQPRVHERGRRQPGVGAAPVRPARAARDRRGHRRPHAAATSATARRRSDLSYDDQVIVPTEQQAAATPTTTVPGDVPAFPGTTPPISSTPTTGSGSSGSGSSSSGSGGGHDQRQRQRRPADRPVGHGLAAERLLLDRHPRRRRRPRLVRDDGRAARRAEGRHRAAGDVDDRLPHRQHDLDRRRPEHRHGDDHRRGGRHDHLRGRR